MLTNRQQQLLDFLHDYSRTQGVMPSTREIQQHFGFASQTAAVSHLRALERKGVIRKLPGKARALVFPDQLGRSESLHVPVYGSIPAGLPTTTEAAPETHIAVDATLLGLTRQSKSLALKVRGDSMINAHILSGDLVILEKSTPRHGDIVAVLIDGETTLKRFILDGENGSTPFLRAENDAYPDLIPASELVIQGVMIGLVRTA